MSKIIIFVGLEVFWFYSYLLQLTKSSSIIWNIFELLLTLDIFFGFSPLLILFLRSVLETRLFIYFTKILYLLVILEWNLGKFLKIFFILRSVNQFISKFYDMFILGLKILILYICFRLC